MKPLLVISEEFPANQIFDGTKGTWQFRYANGDVVTFKTKRGETLWINGSHKLLELGRVLELDGVYLIQRRASEIKASSPDELLAFIERTRVAPSSD